MSMHFLIQGPALESQASIAASTTDSADPTSRAGWPTAGQQLGTGAGAAGLMALLEVLRHQ